MGIPAAFVAVVLVWSTTPLAVKWSSSEEVSFLEGVGIRMVAAALLASLLLRLFRIKPNYSLAAWRMHSASSMGFFLAMLIVYWAAQFVPSGLIALMFGISPLFAGVLGHFFLGERSLSVIRVAALFLAMAGLALIFSGELHIDVRLALPLAGLLFATLLYALSGVLIKRYVVIMHPLAKTSGALWVTSLGFVLVWLLTDASLPDSIDSRTLGAISYLAVFGSLLAFMLYFYLLNHLPVTTVALIPLMTPPTALVIGWLVAGEQVSSLALIGGGVMLCALAIYQWGDWFRSRNLRPAG